MTACIKAKTVGAPGPLPILQKSKRKTVKNGDVVTLTAAQFLGSLKEAPGLFRFKCPSCKQWYEMLYQIGKRRLCLDCLEWRQPKPILKKHLLVTR